MATSISTPGGDLGPPQGPIAGSPTGPVPLPSASTNQTLTMGNIMALWIGAGGDPKWAATMATIALAAESGGKTSAKNVNSNGSYDLGIWQINSSHKPSTMTDAQWTSFIENPYNNATYAVQLFDGARQNGTALGRVWTDPLAQSISWNAPLSLGAAESILAAKGFSGATADAFDPLALTSTAITQLSGEFTKAADTSIPQNADTLGAAQPGANVHVPNPLDALSTLVSDITDLQWWRRVGIGAAGIAILGTGLVIFFVSTSDKKMPTILPV